MGKQHRRGKGTKAQSDYIEPLFVAQDIVSRDEMVGGADAEKQRAWEIELKGRELEQLKAAK